jgi:glycosyltransferase involved in cell wall biosynthesis
MQKLNATGRNSQMDRVIYNYPPARNNKTFLNIPQVESLDDGTLVFGYIGQIIESKGVAYFIEAAKEILRQGLKCHFLVAGNLMYDENFGNRIKSMVTEDYSNHITLLGEVNDVETFYKSIDVLCVPSIKQEPLGNIIVEAKKYSKPCVIFPSGGMPELITHLWDGYLCESQTMESLLTGMLWYERNRSVIKEHSLNSLRSIDLLQIDREHFKQQWLQVFGGVE